MDAVNLLSKWIWKERQAISKLKYGEALARSERDRILILEAFPGVPEDELAIIPDLETYEELFVQVAAWQLQGDIKLSMQDAEDADIVKVLKAGLAEPLPITTAPVPTVTTVDAGFGGFFQSHEDAGRHPANVVGL